MALLENSSPAPVKRTSQIWDHMPRRRKRHNLKNKMMLMLLILVNCCSTLILCSADVQRKDVDGNDRYRNQRIGTSQLLAKAEDNVYETNTNDSGTLDRIQLKKPDNKNFDNNERASEDIEMIQPSHLLRHQEHYKQQQENHQEQNHYTQKQKTKEQHEYEHENQQIYDNSSGNVDAFYRDDNDNDGDEGDDNVDDYDDDDDINDDNEHNRRLRYQQIQEALREPITPSTPHHRRHEHRLEKKLFAKQTKFKWPQHHIRHQHHQHQEISNSRQPQLRHLNHEMTKQNLTNHLYQRTKPLHQRYFDRESSYSGAYTSMDTTEGPRLRHSGPKIHWKPIATYEYLNNPHNRLFNDDANTNSYQLEDIKRVSLSLDANGNENIHNRPNQNVSVNTADEDDDVDDDDDDDDDYSYEDDDKEELSSYSKFSSIAFTNARANVRPLGSMHKSPLPNQHVEAGYEVKHLENDDYDNKDDIADNQEEYNKNASPISQPSSSLDISDESLTENDDDKVSDEKWDKIEHEHYRKQLQHQHAMQALRSRRPINGNSLPPHRYSSYSTSSVNPTATYKGNGWRKRQTVNNDNEENIYSRYYIPGTMTHKKQEELGSPTAILESRRQYAMQQRQNKALASAHHRRVVTEGSCRLPQPRIERIRKDSWKIYTPHCTILHRCADDGGCCPSERQTCAPKRTKNVDLYFFVISLNETQGSIEKLTFVNHTECHCVDRSKQRAPEYGGSRSKEQITNNQIPFLRRATILNCYCPNLFEKILQEDGYCRCDCSSGNMGCDWLKRGMEHFSMNDRKCIIEGRCKLPTCEYGQYIKKHGRCPRREERHLSADVDW